MQQKGDTVQCKSCGENIPIAREEEDRRKQPAALRNGWDYLLHPYRTEVGLAVLYLSPLDLVFLD